ncbi:scp family extracellular subfamily protein [Cystoisospora suis]|uniref:Scp family extracellular subfamily protein n=1 Tax=Cystoisospora suis TaxID=483139 RepID=A0A2C6LBG1_9APIC|nr:scp family extracellular subfamily protein [Cystoisospora suis]
MRLVTVTRCLPAAWLLLRTCRSCGFAWATEGTNSAASQELQPSAAASPSVRRSGPSVYGDTVEAVTPFAVRRTDASQASQDAVGLVNQAATQAVPSNLVAAAEPQQQRRYAQDVTDDCLAYHNYYRSEELGSAALRPLQFSEELLEMVMEIANKRAQENCQVWGHSDRSLRPGAAENLYGTFEDPARCERGVFLWFEEYREFHGTYPGTRWTDWFHLVIGHFTQMMWHTARYMACARTRGCTNDNNQLFCLYKPSGNIAGQAPFSRETWRAMLQREKKYEQYSSTLEGGLPGLALPGMPQTGEATPKNNASPRDAETAIESAEEGDLWSYKTPPGASGSSGSADVVASAKRTAQESESTANTDNQVHIAGDQLEAPPLYDWILGFGIDKPSQSYINQVKAVLQKERITQNWLPRVCSSPDAVNYGVCARHVPDMADSSP